MSRERRHWTQRGRPTGNLAFRVETRRGTALQKVYLPRRGSVRSVGRLVLERIVRRKTTSSPRGRCATERRLLAHWRERDFPVPQDWSDELGDVSADNVALIEFVEGRELLAVLASDALARAERDALLVRFASAWSRRHRRAVEERDPLLIQEHGSFEHVLVRDDDFVVFDLEQAYRGRGNLVARLADEVAGYLRTLHKRVDAATFEADIAALVRGYEAPELLRRFVDVYFKSSNPVGRVFHRLDRWLRGRVLRGGRKYDAMAALARAIDPSRAAADRPDARAAAIRYPGAA